MWASPNASNTKYSQHTQINRRATVLPSEVLHNARLQLKNVQMILPVKKSWLLINLAHSGCQKPRYLMDIVLGDGGKMLCWLKKWLIVLPQLATYNITQLLVLKNCTDAHKKLLSIISCSVMMLVDRNYKKFGMDGRNIHWRNFLVSPFIMKLLKKLLGWLSLIALTTNMWNKNEKTLQPHHKILNQLMRLK